MFLEYQKGLVKFPASNYVTFASKVESVVVRLSAFQGHSDYQRPGFHYLPVDMTATVDRTVDDYLPRAQFKKSISIW